jgi:plasmid maintenance system antidote protein VapI
MSAVAKKRLTEIVVGQKNPKVFRVPADKAKGLIVLLSDYLVDDDEETVSIDEAFQHLYDETSKAAALLRGFRLRDDITQVQLAKKLGTTQSVIAEMERAKRPITKKMAQRIADYFDTDYKDFL